MISLNRAMVELTSLSLLCLFAYRANQDSRPYTLRASWIDTKKGVSR